MAETMSMNKIIHAAVRRDLARFAGALATFPDGSTARAGQLQNAWRFFYGELDYHHHGEHDIAWPALESVGVPRATLDQMDAEHERLAAALGTADTAFATLTRTPTEAAAKDAAAAIADLQAVVDEHLAHEEAELEPVYQANRKGPEMKEMGRKFSKRGGKASGNFFAWVMNGASAEEKAALRVDVPAPVIAILPRLLGRQYTKTVAPVWQ
jgi:hypothetical protein